MFFWSKTKCIFNYLSPIQKNKKMENDTGMISFRKNTDLCQNIGHIRENAKARASLPHIKVQLDTVDSNPLNIG